MDFQDSYDKVAHDYAEEFSDELAKKPFDRKMLELLIEKVDDLGVICDMGCGPGQIAAFLDSRDAKACGIDNSAGMIAEAKLRHPDLAFQRGDMLELREVADGSFGGIAAFYSIIHIPRESVVNALRELKRVLRSKGVLLLTFHRRRNYSSR